MEAAALAGVAMVCQARACTDAKAARWSITEDPTQTLVAASPRDADSGSRQLIGSSGLPRIVTLTPTVTIRITGPKTLAEIKAISVPTNASVGVSTIALALASRSAERVSATSARVATGRIATGIGLGIGPRTKAIRDIKVDNSANERLVDVVAAAAKLL